MAIVNYLKKAWRENRVKLLSAQWQDKRQESWTAAREIPDDCSTGIGAERPSLEISQIGLDKATW